MNYYRLAQSKYKTAVRIAKFLRFAPGVRMIAVANSLSYNRAREQSDIDLFIIAQKGRVWTARFFTLLFLDIVGARPLICASFFLSEDALNISPYKIAEHDPYLAFWIRELKPLYVEGGVYERFINANNWSIAKAPFVPYVPNYKRRVRKLFLKPFLNAVVMWLDERIYRRLQIILFLPLVKRVALQWDSRVVISNCIIKMHTNDRRLEFKLTNDQIPMTKSQ